MYHLLSMVLVASCLGADLLPVKLVHYTKWRYLRSLQHYLKPSARQVNLAHNWVFLRDNDPKHTLKLVERVKVTLSIKHALISSVSKTMCIVLKSQVCARKHTTSINLY